MAFLGSAIGGFGEGLGSGVDIASKLAALRENARLRQARAAVGQMYSAGAPQPPAPGQASMPAGPPPLGNTSPDPMMGGGGGLALPSNGAPQPPQAMPAASMPAGAPQPMPTAQPSPDPMMGPVSSPMANHAAPTATSAGPPGPAAMGPTGQPLTGAAASSGDVVKDAQSTIMGIAQQIKTANPKIDPETLFNATQQHIEAMKGVRNDVRDYMQMQIELAKQQYGIQRAELRLQGVEDTAHLNYQGRTEAAGIRGDAARDVAGTNAGARIGSARIGADSRRDVASTQAGARIGSAQIGADSRENVAETGAGASDYRADQGYRGKVDSSAAFNGSKDRTPAPPRRAPRPRGAAPANQTWTADTLRAAVSAGRMTRQQGEQIARTNGWIR